MLRTKRNSYGVIARKWGLPEKADELRQHLLELVRLTRNEKGCLSCGMIENRYDSTEFTILEEWSDEEAHNAHFGANRIQNALQFLPNRFQANLTFASTYCD